MDENDKQQSIIGQTSTQDQNSKFFTHNSNQFSYNNTNEYLIEDRCLFCNCDTSQGEEAKFSNFAEKLKQDSFQDFQYGITFLMQFLMSNFSDIPGQKNMNPNVSMIRIDKVEWEHMSYLSKIYKFNVQNISALEMFKDLNSITTNCSKSNYGFRKSSRNIKPPIRYIDSNCNFFNRSIIANPRRTRSRIDKPVDRFGVTQKPNKEISLIDLTIEDDESQIQLVERPKRDKSNQRAVVKKSESQIQLVEKPKRDKSNQKAVVEKSESQIQLAKRPKRDKSNQRAVVEKSDSQIQLEKRPKREKSNQRAVVEKSESQIQLSERPKRNKSNQRAVLEKSESQIKLAERPKRDKSNQRAVVEKAELQIQLEEGPKTIKSNQRIIVENSKSNNASSNNKHIQILRNSRYSTRSLTIEQAPQYLNDNQSNTDKNFSISDELHNTKKSSKSGGLNKAKKPSENLDVIFKKPNQYIRKNILKSNKSTKQNETLANTIHDSGIKVKNATINNITLPKHNFDNGENNEKTLSWKNNQNSKANKLNTLTEALESRQRESANNNKEKTCSDEIEESDIQNEIHINSKSKRKKCIKSKNKSEESKTNSNISSSIPKKTTRNTNAKQTLSKINNKETEIISNLLEIQCVNLTNEAISSLSSNGQRIFGENSTLDGQTNTSQQSACNFSSRNIVRKSYVDECSSSDDDIWVPYANKKRKKSGKFSSKSKSDSSVTDAQSNSKKFKNLTKQPYKDKENANNDKEHEYIESNTDENLFLKKKNINRRMLKKLQVIDTEPDSLVILTPKGNHRPLHSQITPRTTLLSNLMSNGITPVTLNASRNKKSKRKPSPKETPIDVAHNSLKFPTGKNLHLAMTKSLLEEIPDYYETLKNEAEPKLKHTRKPRGNPKPKKSEDNSKITKEIKKPANPPKKQVRKKVKSTIAEDVDKENQLDESFTEKDPKLTATKGSKKRLKQTLGIYNEIAKNDEMNAEDPFATMFKKKKLTKAGLGKFNLGNLDFDDDLSVKTPSKDANWKINSTLTPRTALLSNHMAPLTPISTPSHLMAITPVTSNHMETNENIDVMFHMMKYNKKRKRNKPILGSSPAALPKKLGKNAELPALPSMDEFNKQNEDDDMEDDYFNDSNL